MKSREVSGENSGNATGGEWDSLGDVPFFGEDPFKKKHDDNRKERKKHEEQIALRRDKKAKSRVENEEFLKEYLDVRDRYEVSKKANEEEAFKFKSEFEKRATGEEDFEEWIARGEEGISKTTVEYEGAEIPVYTLDGHEFLFLVHNIGYRATDTLTTNREAREHSNALLENPSLFETKAKRVNALSGGGKYGSRYSANISTSLVSNKIPNEFSGAGTARRVDPTDVIYGFSKIGRRNIIGAENTDARTTQGMTSNWHGYSDMMPPSVMGIDELEEDGLERQRKGIKSIYNYNEVAIDRYEPDSDSPLRPDMIIISKQGLWGTIPERQLKHAKHFGIPIVILDENAYIERNRQDIGDKAA